MNKKISIFLLPSAAFAGLVLAGLFYISGNDSLAFWILRIALIIGLIPLVWKLIRDLLKGHFGVDVIAVTAIVVSFLLKQDLAGVVIVLMLSGGEALESYALDRARKELTHLMSNAPTIAHVKKGDRLEDLTVKEVHPSDELVVKPGEQIPVDGIVLEGISTVDESAITGESVPIHKQSHSYVSSGAVNLDGVLTVRALKPASESQYERIVKLVRQAQESRAPIVRLADRYAVWFTVITFIIAALAWYISHDAIRLLAVLVVATPCPLILATPIAVMTGISWAASRGIIVKSGGSLEKLGEAKSFVFDKTGTLTLGEPEVLGAESFGPPEEEILHIAASVDQLSTHIFARSLVRFVRKEVHKELQYPDSFKEYLGDGVSAVMNGKNYLLGKLDFLKQQGVVINTHQLSHHADLRQEGLICVYLAEDALLVGCVTFADVLRPEMKGVFRSIVHQGIRHVVMLTGDKRMVAEKIAAEVGLQEFEAEMLPEQKLEYVKKMKASSGPVVMVGDGVNDAPALAAADVGIALGAHGSTAASDAGDIVILVNSMERVSEALYIARRVLRIAKQSIFVGIGLSIVLMLIAAAGGIMPVYGALLQEVVDVTVILNALRVHFTGHHYLRMIHSH